jgi:hypothetical protein
MKKLILFISLFSFISNAQTIITFEDDSFVTASDLVVGPNNDEVSIVVDPTDASNKVLKIIHSTNQWWDNHGGVEIPYTQFGSLGGTITFDIWTDHSAGNPGTYGYMLKLEGNQSGGGNIENSFAVAGAGSWETITVDLADCTNATGNCTGQENSASTFSKIMYFHWGGGDPSSPAPDTLYIDNITYQNGDVLVEPAADAEPASAAPVPTHNASDVMSVVSAHYTQSIPFTNVNPGWNQSGSASELTINSEPVVKIKNMNYQGHEFDETDVSAMTHVHMDIWSEAGGESMRFFPLDGSNPEESFNLTLSAGWNQFDLDLSTLANWDGGLNQIKYDNDGNNGNLPLIYVSNLYFYNSGTASVGKIQDFELSLYPNPVKDIANIETGESIDMVRIYDLTGRMVKQANPYSNNFRIDVTSLNKGVYMVKLNSGDKTGSIKLIKDN